jgi:hypothetical protein
MPVGELVPVIAGAVDQSVAPGPIWAGVCIKAPVDGSGPPGAVVKEKEMGQRKVEMGVASTESVGRPINEEHFKTHGLPPRRALDLRRHVSGAYGRGLEQWPMLAPSTTNDTESNSRSIGTRSPRNFSHVVWILSRTRKIGVLYSAITSTASEEPWRCPL